MTEQKKNHKVILNSNISTIIIIMIFLILGFTLFNYFYIPKIAYVDSAKLMIGFSEADKINKEIEAEKKQYEGNLKALEDSVKVHMDLMSKEYDSASPQNKQELREKLREWNVKMNQYQKAGVDEIAKNHQEKMGAVIKKMNAFISEYGKEHNYDLILGTTAGGNILYAKESKQDITNKVIKGLNERYK